MLRWLNRLEEIISCACMMIMTIVIIAQVFFRYCLANSLDWPEEFSRFLFIALVYLGSAYAEQMNSHLRITILCTSGGAWFARVLPRFAQIVTVLFSGLMVIWGMRMVGFVYNTGQLAPAMQIPMWIVYLCMPLGMACIGLRALEKLFRHKPEPHVAQQGQ